MTLERFDHFEVGMLLHIRVVEVEVYPGHEEVRMEMLDPVFQDCFFKLDIDDIEEY